MEGASCSTPSSSGSPNPARSTSPAKVKVNIGIIPAPGGGGCSETANPSEEERLKGAEDEDNEAGGRGSEVPPVREQLHPLQNPVILAHLFERCPPELLATCRLVSKQWLELSLTSWRTTAQLRLFHVPGGDQATPTSQQYLDFMNNPENTGGWKTHRNMKLMSWSHDLSKEAIQSFWNRVGRSLTSLELVSCEFPHVEDLRKIIFGSCPNLKRLSLEGCTFLEPVPVEDFRELKYLEPIFGEQANLRVLSLEEMPGHDLNSHRLPIHWLEVLSHFPNLTSLKVSLKRGVLPRTESVHEVLFKAIEIIRQRDPKKLCLRTLELDPWLKFFVDHGPHPDLSHFEGLQLPLQSLEIEVWSGSTGERQPGNPLLEDVLSRHRDTLLRITVSRERRHGFHLTRVPYSWGFPCTVALEELKELRIQMLCTSMEFLKNTPKLKKLEFVEAPGFGHCSFVETRIFPETETSPLLEVKLLHLTEFRMDYRMTLDDIAIFARMMPSVIKLTLSLNDKLFSTVCQSWGNLREMEVLGYDLTDEGVTGMDGEGKKIACANITNLNGLDSFKFWSGNLTDRSVFHGFLKLPELKVLEVCEEVMPLDEAARKSLQDKNIAFRGEHSGDRSEFSLDDSCRML